MKRKGSKLTPAARKRVRVVEAESRIPTTLTYFSRALPFSAKDLPGIYVKSHTPNFIKGLKHVLSIDPSLLKYIEEKPAFGVCLIKPLKHADSNQFYFEKLASGLISQQISGKAADAIKQRLCDKIGDDGEFPHATKFYQSTIDDLRSCGLSYKKAEYIQRLSRAFMDEIPIEDIDEGVKFTPKYFNSVDDETLRDDLERFKGIGPWSSSMFAMFGLERLDIFEPSDLGIRRGMTEYLKARPELKSEIDKLFKDGTVERVFKKKASKDKYIDDQDMMNAVACQFKPYRSIFMYILWRISETSVAAMAH